MDYRDEIYAYEDEAEDNYDHYYEDGYYGLEGMEDDGEVEEIHYIGYPPNGYSNYVETSLGSIDPNDRTLTVRVKNDGTTEAQAIIFGGNENAAQPTGVTVTVEESSHNEVREESKANPFKIAGLKYSVSDPLQFDSILQITRRTATGSSTVRVYQPRNATSPQNHAPDLIDDDNFQMDVTGQDSIRFKILPNTTAVFTFTIKARANMGNVLKGQNVAELSTTPRTTGLPQLDLVRRSQPTAFGLPARKPAMAQQMPQQVVVRKVRPAAKAQPQPPQAQPAGGLRSRMRAAPAAGQAPGIMPRQRPGGRVLTKVRKMRGQ